MNHLNLKQNYLLFIPWLIYVSKTNIQPANIDTLI